MLALQDLPAIAPALSVAAERRAFSRLRLADGIFKTTVARRLGDVDTETIRLLSPAATRIEVIDVGASSGTTSLELVEALEAAGFRSALTLTDLSLTARQVQVHRGYRVLVDGRGQLLQHQFLGVPIRPWRRRLDLVTQFWIVIGLANAWYRRQAAREQIALTGARRILLVAPRAAAHPAITCEEGDVFATLPSTHAQRFDIVRAANLLLPDVFSADRISLAITQLKARMRGPGALLVLARSPAPGRPGANRATIYRMDGEGALLVAARIGGGSEIEALVGT